MSASNIGDLYQKRWNVELFIDDLKTTLGMAVLKTLSPARPLRFQYPGAIYHVMACGDGGKTVFETNDDRLDFLKRLE